MIKVLVYLLKEEMKVGQIGLGKKTDLPSCDNATAFMRLRVAKNERLLFHRPREHFSLNRSHIWICFNIFVRIKSLPNWAKKSEQIIQLFVSELALFHKRQLFFVWSSNTMWTWNAQESHVGVAS